MVEVVKKKKCKIYFTIVVRPPLRPLTFIGRSSGMLMLDTCRHAPRRRLWVYSRNGTWRLEIVSIQDQAYFIVRHKSI